TTSNGALVNGANRSSCSGPRLLTNSPITTDPDDHAPTRGQWAPRTSRERAAKAAASPTAIHPVATARATATTNGVSDAANPSHSSLATRRPGCGPAASVTSAASHLEAQHRRRHRYIQALAAAPVLDAHPPVDRSVGGQAR